MYIPLMPNLKPIQHNTTIADRKSNKLQVHDDEGAQTWLAVHMLNRQSIDLTRYIYRMQVHDMCLVADTR